MNDFFYPSAAFLLATIIACVTAKEMLDTWISHKEGGLYEEPKDQEEGE